MSSSEKRHEFWLGVRTEAPILLGVIPFGMIYGALAVNAHLTLPLSQAMSAIVFAGSSQFIAAQMIGAGVSGLVLLLVVAVVNLRHALYSASIAPYLHHLSTGWKFLLAYLLTDEAYAVTITHYQAEGPQTHKHWFFLGAGLTLWLSWQISTALGIFIGAQLPQDWPLGFFLPLTFIAVVVPAIKDRAAVAAAVVAALVGVLAIGLPFKIGLLIAAAAGILAGMGVEGKTQ